MSQPALLWHLYCIPRFQLTDPPKRKYVIPVCREEPPDARIRFFYVSSDIHPWFGRDPTRLLSQVRIRATGHRIPSYDSFVNCWELRRYREEGFRGCDHHPVSSEVKSAIQAAVCQSTTIQPEYKRLILDG